MADNWLQDARKRMEKKGTVGSFSAAARKAHMTTHAFALKEKKSGSSLMKKRANFALNASKGR